MKNNLLSISEFAKMCNVTTEPLRFYDRKGLFHPDYVDSKSKYRYYNYSRYRCLKVITNLRSQGFSISQIHHIFSADKQEILINYYNHALNDIDKEIEKLLEVRKNMTSIVNFLTAKNIPKNGWELKELEERPIFSIENSVIKSEAEYYKSISNLEVYLRKKDVDKNLIFTNNYLACHYDINTNEIYNLSILAKDEKSHILSKGLYLCKVIKCRLFNIQKYISDMKSVLEKMNLKRNGSALVVALGESVILSPCINMMYELQIPVVEITNN